LPLTDIVNISKFIYTCSTAVSIVTVQNWSIFVMSFPSYVQNVLQSMFKVLLQIIYQPSTVNA